MKHIARKRFGQNFLIDDSVIEGIIQAIRPEAGQNIVEIGPGRGALTGPLVEACGTITAVELDRDLIPQLQKRFGDKIKLIEADALKFDFTQIKPLALSLSKGPSIRLVGNLPYNISTPLLFHLMKYSPLIQDMHFMLQKEVVERIIARPGNKDYGRLSVMIQYYCRAEAVLQVPPEAFEPAPKVDSMVIRLVPYQKPPHPVQDIKHLEAVLQQAFNQRRKTLANALKNLMPSEQIKRLGIDPSLRPETLSLADFVSLANSLD